MKIVWSFGPGSAGLSALFSLNTLVVQMCGEEHQSLIKWRKKKVQSGKIENIAGSV
jgi:hypothetical protein